MFVNPNIMQEFINNTGRERWLKANSYQLQGRVQIENVGYDDKDDFNISSLVLGHRSNYKVYIEVERGELSGISCECPDFHKGNGFCKHVVATYLEFVKNKEYEADILKDRITYVRNIPESNKKYRNFLEILDTFYERKEVIPKEDIKKEIRNQIHIEPKFLYSEYNKELKVSFKIGIKQLYKLKNLSDFYTLMKNKEEYRYGTKLEFIHTEEAFLEQDRPLLKYLLEQAEMIKSINNNGRHYYVNPLSDSEILLTPTGLDILFDILKDKEIDFENTYVTTKVKFVDQEPDIHFEIENVNEKECRMVPNIEVYNAYTVLEGDKYIYFLKENKLYRCNREFKETTLKLLEIFRKNIAEEILFSKEYLTPFYNIVMPKMEKHIQIEEKDLEQIQQYIPEKLGVKMLLDMDQRGYITAEIRFCYGNIEINPLIEEKKQQEKIARNVILERDIIIDITNSGFRLDQKNKILVMPNDDDIYEFLSYKIEDYMKRFEVLATENLRMKQIKQPQIGTIGVKVENNLLNIDLSKIQIDREELKEMMQKYRMKKKYHKLKDGSFIDLENNNDLAFIDSLLKGMEIDYQELNKNNLRLPVYRSMYLEKLLEKVETIEVEKDQNYTTMVREIESKGKEDEIKIPETIESTLRHYQKIGYKWLKTIDEYQFGGILADDMGLRKDHTSIGYYIRICERDEKRRKKTIDCNSTKFFSFKLAK